MLFVNFSFRRRPVLLLYLCLGLSVLLVIHLFWQLLFNGGDNGFSHRTIAAHPNLIPPTADGMKVKAAFVVLTRNSELDGVRQAIQQMESRFNHKFMYPYVFLNDEEFTEEFKEATSSLTKAETKYGKDRQWL